ncbi:MULTISPECIES: methanogenesis marker 7 protein [Methanohalophilus]|uniref:Methanogenesis marker 7 protein n=1 Tax=Methanohalophilus euhalobius TaxID=51203 RepID=A0A285G1E0_9EURY|nr:MULTISPECIES: methanogenesis marker 7 protein [Methanohalophilus]RNI11369.1 methanogenesis marker 7 protein [Methanohalophilus euhalobius]TCL11751.1 putative methanogenesis marker protein 7 [Methanohalophilus euhalobius]SNY16291.1 putative methanogenesis marker protein 7 [Methanohalophilus euhalobius]
MPVAAVLEPYVYEGGVHKHGLIIELLEDLGGYLVQSTPAATEINLVMLIPRKDVPLMEELAKNILGKLTRAPLTGTEIAVVSPTLAYHHLPHSACDVAEHLRRDGANTNMLGLARGMGRRVALSQDYERKLINEHDIAVYSFGNFSDCIMNKKPKLFSGVDVPIVATGGPDLSTDDVEGADVYVGGIGRVSHRLRNEGEIDSLDVLNKTVGEVVDKLREEISRDPLAVLPARVMKEIKEQVPEINDVLTPAPITLQLDGMRVKLPFDQFHEKLEQLDLDEDVSLSDVANIMPSKMKDYILIKIRRRSETGFTI